MTADTSIDTSPIVVEMTTAASAERAWAALTDRDEMVRWYFETIDAFAPRVGAESRFVVDAGERTFVHHWRVTEAQPNRRIAYDWLYPEHEGAGHVTFDIIAGAGETTVRVTCVGIHSFPQDVPEFRRDACVGGWQYFLKQRLAAYLAA